MKILAALGVVFLALVFIRAAVNKTTVKDEGKGIQFFQGTWDEALELAKKEDKLIFLDAYASWCGPCKRMASQTFVSTEAGNFYNENFINVKMDMEKGEGPTIAQKYNVRSYPSLFFINGSGSVQYQAEGFRDPSSLVNLGKEAITQ